MFPRKKIEKIYHKYIDNFNVICADIKENILESLDAGEIEYITEGDSPNEDVVCKDCEEHKTKCIHHKKNFKQLEKIA